MGFVGDVIDNLSSEKQVIKREVRRHKRKTTFKKISKGLDDFGKKQVFKGAITATERIGKAKLRFKKGKIPKSFRVQF